MQKEAKIYVAGQRGQTGSAIDIKLKCKDRVVWDANKPDGTPQKLMDISKLNGLRWRPALNLAGGMLRPTGTIS